MAINPPPDVTSSMGGLMGGGGAAALGISQATFAPKSFDLVHMPCLPMEVLNSPAFMRKHIIKLNESLSNSSFMIGQSMMSNLKMNAGSASVDLERN